MHAHTPTRIHTARTYTHTHVHTCMYTRAHAHTRHPLHTVFMQCKHANHVNLSCTITHTLTQSHAHMFHAHTHTPHCATHTCAHNVVIVCQLFVRCCIIMCGLDASHTICMQCRVSVASLRVSSMCCFVRTFHDDAFSPSSHNRRDWSNRCSAATR